MRALLLVLLLPTAGAYVFWDYASLGDDQFLLTNPEGDDTAYFWDDNALGGPPIGQIAIPADRTRTWDIPGGAPSGISRAAWAVVTEQETLVFAEDASGSYMTRVGEQADLGWSYWPILFERDDYRSLQQEVHVLSYAPDNEVNIWSPVEFKVGSTTYPAGITTTFKLRSDGSSNDQLTVTADAPLTGLHVSSKFQTITYSADRAFDVDPAGVHAPTTIATIVPPEQHAGQHFVVCPAAAFVPTMQQDSIRVMALQPGTTVTAGDATFELNRGEWAEYGADTPHIIESNRPIQVARLASGIGADLAFEHPFVAGESDEVVTTNGPGRFDVVAAVRLDGLYELDHPWPTDAVTPISDTPFGCVHATGPEGGQVRLRAAGPHNMHVYREPGAMAQAGRARYTVPPPICPTLVEVDQFFVQSGKMGDEVIFVMNPENRGLTIEAWGSGPVDWTIDANVVRLDGVGVDPGDGGTIFARLQTDDPACAGRFQPILEIQIVVLPPDPCPSFQSPPTYDLYVGEAWRFVFDIWPMEPIVDGLVESTLSMGIDSAQRTLIYSATKADLGDHDVQVTLWADECPAFSHRFTLTIKQLPESTPGEIACPALLSPATTMDGTVGRQVQELFRVASPDGMTWAMRGDDPLMVDERTGWVSWIPSSPGVQNGRIRVVAYDPACDHEHALVLTSVAAPVRCPRIADHEPLTTAAVNQVVPRTWRVDGAGGFTLRYEGPGGPASTNERSLTVQMSAGPGNHQGKITLEPEAPHCKQQSLSVTLRVDAPATQQPRTPVTTNTAAPATPDVAKPRDPPETQTNDPQTPAPPKDRNLVPWLIPVVLVAGLAVTWWARRR